MTNPTEPTTRPTRDALVNATPKKKLIEVSLPLEVINAESVREKSIRSGHPFPLHIWWSRKPLATARAVLFAQLVDDPASRPDLFPTMHEQDAERARLHEIISRLVKWENRADERLWNEARREILRSNPDGIPTVIDPFAGGGSIPLEAQRLGIPTASSDLNPVAVLIERALLQLPQMFLNQRPIHPSAGANLTGWDGTRGLAEDVRKYGADLRSAAQELLDGLYPSVYHEDGTLAEPIAWKWARTVRSPNPANPVEVPLVNSWWLSTKPAKPVWVEPRVEADSISYTLRRDRLGPTKQQDGTVGRAGAVSIADGTPISLDYIRAEARAGRMGYQLLAAVVKSKSGRGREYVAVDRIRVNSSSARSAGDAPPGETPDKGLGINIRAYGMREWTDLFLPRQLQTMVVLTDLVGEIREQVLSDARAAGLSEGVGLSEGGNGAQAYADSVAVYLALGVSRTADLGNSLATWSNSRDQTRNLFSKQAIQIAWDFVEVYPFAGASGDIGVALDTIAEAIEQLPHAEPAKVSPGDAASVSYRGMVVSTDPPYFDYVGYADLSDFFYVWLRRALRSLALPELETVQTPKQDELVANPHRWGGKVQAEQFFTAGFERVFSRMRSDASRELPITVYYAYKQQESTTSTASKGGWYTILQAIIGSGWEVTATWPMRSERAGRTRDIGSNALASSIVLACRPRPEEAPAATRRSFAAALKAELPGALRALMMGNIAPVDLAQAAIGPGIAAFSRYSRVREADGSDMSVREALLLINSALDDVLEDQTSDFDPDTRFAVKWYRQYGWGQESSGIADQLARSSDTSIGALERGGIFEAKGGKSRLLSPTVLDNAWDVASDNRVSVWEATVRLAAVMAKSGADAVAEMLPMVQTRVNLDAVKELGFLLYHEAEKKTEAKDAILFNGLVSAWGDVNEQARKHASSPRAVQQAFDFDEDGD